MATSISPTQPTPTARSPQAGWARLFGYDVFISFALGPAPRGCRAYASDLARRLRERGFTVFFSEDEAPVGAELDGTLRRALRSSRILVVVANRGTLAEPRWVRTEVEEYRRARPGGVIVPINVDGALLDPRLAEATKAWMPFEGRIWVDETAESCESGRVSDDTVQRLVTAPHAVRSLVRLRIVLGMVLALFAGLAAFATLQRYEAVQERDRAQQALLATSARQAELLSRDGRAHEGWDGLVQALAQARPRVDGPLPEGFLEAALTTLVEDRRGPELVFDTRAEAPSPVDGGDAVPPVWAFEARGIHVAAAVGSQLAVWHTGNGTRLAQVTLNLTVERLTFAGQGSLVVAEGVEPLPAGQQGRGVPRAVVVELAEGRVTSLPLTLCEQWVPCIAGDGAVTRLRPLDELSARSPPQGTAYLAAAAGDLWLEGVSREQFVLLRRETAGGDRSWWLLDRRTGGRLQLELRFYPTFDGRPGKPAAATAYALARDASVLVASASNDSAMLVLPIESGSNRPQLGVPISLQARLAGATQGVRLSANGKTLHYQNLRYGTGTGVGQGRTVVLDVASGREVWARGDGEVAWGESDGLLIALQEHWAETQLLAADTGATWFTVPGRPLGFDPSGRMLLMWDRVANSAGAGGAGAARWPRLRLLEALPVRQFARDAQGPASQRSACVPPAHLRFLTLGERYDRLWNRDDWHLVTSLRRVPMPDERVVRPSAPVVAVSAPASAPATEAPQWVRLEAQGNRWRLHGADKDQITMLDRAEVLDRFPLLASDLRPGKDLEALLTASADGHWRAVATAVTDGDESCKGWARWRLHRGRDGSQALSGCTTGELPGSGALPAVSFVPALQGSPLLVAVPADTCRYELLEPEGGARHGHVVPVFGNGVRIERIANGLVAVHSTDWYGGTLAYQLQAPGSDLSGPVFMLADRDDGVGDLGKKASHAPGVRTLFDTRMTAQEHSTGIAAAFAPDGHTLAIRAQGSTTTLGVPPWGQRLRDRLRQAVRARAEKASSSP